MILAVTSVEITDLTPLRVPLKNTYVSYSLGNCSSAPGNIETNTENLLQHISQIEPEDGNSSYNIVKTSSEQESAGEFPETIPPQLDFEGSSSKTTPITILNNGVMKNKAQKLLGHISKSNVNSSTNLLFQTISFVAHYIFLFLFVVIF